MDDVDHDGGADIELLAGMYDCVADVVGERDRLRAVVEGFRRTFGADLMRQLDVAEAERDRLRAALRAVMVETGTSTLAHHYARDALGEAADG